MAAEIDRQTEDEWIRRIGQGEGFMPTEKKDPVAGMDIGYGHSLTFNGGWGYVNKTLGLDRNNRRLTEDQAKDLCRHDLQNVYKALDNNFPGWRDLDGAGKYVMVDMCYNMGVAKLKQFVKMRAALWEGDYETASKEILNSAYATQTGQRARKNSELIRTGHWYDVDPRRVSKYDKYQTRQKGEAVSNRPLVDGATPKSHDAGQRSSASAQNSQESESSARSETQSGNTKSKSVQNRALHEQEWIKHIVSGQKFYNTPTDAIINGKPIQVIGYGHVINGNPDKHAIRLSIRKDINKVQITQREAEIICGNDLGKSGGIYDRLNNKYPWWTDLDPKAQAIMVDMCYNKEIGYKDYPQIQDTLNALKNKDYTAAINEMKLLDFNNESRNNRLQRNIALLQEIDRQPTNTQQITQTTVVAPTNTVNTSNTNVAKDTVLQNTPKTETKKQLHEDSLKAHKILSNFNERHRRYKFKNIEDTRLGIENVFADKDVAASKIITKALMNPTVVAQKLGLKDEKGRPLRSSRAVVEALSKLDKQQDADKINAMVEFAKAKNKSR